ncbi:MAG: hydrogenase expression/formation C-terminal domain-containing protein [Woeseiaceae bacterium]|nr:hydrogenase expression/formation C-terminal domain-containing protein [Woeseiaceae bacterium]
MNAANPFGESPRGNVEPVLSEVLHALDRLLETGEPTVIDLGRLPFGPGEVEELERNLGTGEIRAELDALGASSIRETVYPGVWWLEHYNAAGELAGTYIEITRVPEILKSQDADVAAGRARLHERISKSDEADVQ